MWFLMKNLQDLKQWHHNQLMRIQIRRSEENSWLRRPSDEAKRRQLNEDFDENEQDHIAAIAILEQHINQLGNK